MAQQMILLKIGSPDIKGESVVADHKDETQLHSCSMGGANSAGFHGTQGLGSGTFKASDVVCTAIVGKQSTQLLKHCFEGTHCGEITVTFLKTGSGPKPLTFMKWTLKDCVISSYSVSGSGGGAEEFYTETFTIAYTQIKYEYHIQSADKGTTTLANSAEFNLSQAQSVGA